jgi:hypothetical protein
MSREQCYYGIASANGLESWIFDPNQGIGALLLRLDAQTQDGAQFSQTIAQMVMSACANPQRWSVVFRAKVTAEVSEEIQSLMDEGEHEQALIVLKDRANEIALASGVPGAKRMWEKIPNLEIDPF